MRRATSAEPRRGHARISFDYWCGLDLSCTLESEIQQKRAKATDPSSRAIMGTKETHNALEFYVA
jgi:hypothetical protein